MRRATELPFAIRLYGNPGCCLSSAAIHSSQR
jgi:hypothetical protein